MGGRGDGTVGGSRGAGAAEGKGAAELCGAAAEVSRQTLRGRVGVPWPDKTSNGFLYFMSTRKFSKTLSLIPQSRCSGSGSRCADPLAAETLCAAIFNIKVQLSSSQFPGVCPGRYS